jgi:hypothetical protein
MAIGLPGIGVGMNRGGLEAVVRSLFAQGEQGVWYDPGDLSTLFQDAGATTRVTATGQTVALARDKSGRGNHLTLSNCTLQQDAAGFRYLSFNGTDTGGVTSSINLTGTDKLTVFAGVYKVNDVAQGTIIETASAPLTVNGTVGLVASSGAGPNYLFRLYHTTDNNRTTSAYAAPVASVLSASMNLAATLQVDQLIARVNGVAPVLTGGVATSVGAFANQPLYVGRRGGTTNPLNGRLYGLIVRGAATDPSALGNVERYIGSRMGIAL